MVMINSMKIGIGRGCLFKINCGLFCPDALSNFAYVDKICKKIKDCLQKLRIP